MLRYREREFLLGAGECGISQDRAGRWLGILQQWRLLSMKL
jgi:hypothetical protein